MSSRRIREQPVAAEELERAKDNVKGRVVLALESTGARMERLGASLLAEMPILELDETIERIEAVDADAVAALAAELLAPQRLSRRGDRARRGRLPARRSLRSLPELAEAP